ncbi:MAG: uroporphyrinogen-III synthase, partial [Acidimicrobiales bacterium]
MPLGQLEGFVVGVTADRRWQEQAELLRRRGATVLHGPTIATQYLADDEELHQATNALIEHPPAYLVATTGIGMRAWLETAGAWGLGDRLAGALARARVVARGPKAAGALQGAGLEVWARSATERMDDVLAHLLEAGVAGQRVAFQQHGADSPEFSAALIGAGAEVVEVPVYRWRLPRDPAPA